MSYFPDLSPYAYGHGSHPGVVHVGWLDNEHPFATGDVDVRLTQKMKQLASKPVELYRGKHICELCTEPPDIVTTYPPNRIVIDPKCSWAPRIAGRSSNGEICVQPFPTDIEAHNYLAPDPFLRAIEETLSEA